MTFIEFIEQLKTEFTNRNNNDAWNNRIKYCNENVPNQNAIFQAEYPFSYYVGNLFVDEGGKFVLNQKIKLIFITMNPMLVDGYDKNSDPKLFDKESLSDFIYRMNNWFENQNRTNSVVFNGCEKLARSIINDNNQYEGYQCLNKNAVVLDWFPFYSRAFDLNIVNDAPFYYLQILLDHVISELPNAKVIIANNGVEKAIKSLAKNNSIIHGPATTEIQNLDTYTIGNKTIYKFATTYKANDLITKAGNYIREN